jgi:hypothetical protein
MMTGKYKPLELFLSKVSEDKQEILLSFDRVKQIINDELPASAYEHRAWWSNETQGVHVSAHAWMNSGWLVDKVDFKQKYVQFIRGDKVKRVSTKRINKPKYQGTKEYALVYTELISAAKYRGTVTYQELAKLIGLPLRGSYMGREIGQLLGEISEDEVEKGRPMLSAVAVGVDGKPGPGFFNLAKQIGKLLDDKDQNTFWRTECQELYKIWKVKL